MQLRETHLVQYTTSRQFFTKYSFLVDKLQTSRKYVKMYEKRKQENNEETTHLFKDKQGHHVAILTAILFVMQLRVCSHSIIRHTLAKFPKHFPSGNPRHYPECILLREMDDGSFQNYVFPRF